MGSDNYTGNGDGGYGAKPRSVWEAEEARERALARKYEAQAKQAEYEAEQTRLELLDQQRDEALYKSGDFENRVLRFHETVGQNSTRAAIQTLTNFHRLSPGCDIKIVLNSPGGSVIDGMALFDHIRWLSGTGHKITTIAQGMAASTAAILLQSGDYRIMSRESYLLIHEVSAVAWGTTGQIEDEVELIKKMNSRIVDIFAARSTLSRRAIMTRWQRRDWYIDSAEALKHGFVDEITGAAIPE